MTSAGSPSAITLRTGPCTGVWDMSACSETQADRRNVRNLPADRGGNLPALSLTAYARGEDRTKALRAGFNMHLAKPIDPGELLVVIATLVNGYLKPRSDA